MVLFVLVYAFLPKGEKSIVSISMYPAPGGVWGGFASPRSPFACRSAGGAAARTAAREPKGSFGGPLALQTSPIRMRTGVDDSYIEIASKNIQKKIVGARSIE